MDPVVITLSPAEARALRDFLKRNLWREIRPVTIHVIGEVLDQIPREQM